MQPENNEFLYEEESYAIRGAIYEVYKVLGTGFLENVYQEALEEELKARSIPFERQKYLKIKYKDKFLKQTYIADIVCYSKIILEIKAIETITRTSIAQLSNYLSATGYKLGFVVNFGSFPQTEIKPVRLDARINRFDNC